MWKTVLIKLSCLFLLLPILSCNEPPNFQRVDEKVYRSGQPSTRQLATVIETYKIKSVINLRGPERGNGEEERVCRLLNVRYYMFDFENADEDMLHEFVATLRNAEYPILIHCRWGIDRTQQAINIYLSDPGF